jgi:hypothetical protein
MLNLTPHPSLPSNPLPPSLGSGVRRRSRVGLLFDRFVGVHGSYFEHRVMLQQFCTVLLQSWTKLPVLGAAVWAAEATRSAAISTVGVVGIVERAFWMLLGALLLNALVSRVGCALVDCPIPPRHSASALWSLSSFVLVMPFFFPYPPHSLLSFLPVSGCVASFRR